MSKIVFTGGHHNSALATAIACKELGYDVIWYGHRHSMWGDSADSAEYKEVVNANIPFYNLKAGKLYHTFHPLKLLRLPLGFIHAAFLLSHHKPDCIVSFGGYLAVPVVIVGYFLGIPSLTHEQTVSSGWANRLISKFATIVAVSWHQSSVHFPKHKVHHTGLPLRQQIIEIPKLSSPSSKPVIYITGGKQGSHSINSVVFKVLPELKKHYHIIHQTGTSSLSNDEQVSKQLISDSYESFGYDSSQAIAALHLADVVVGRSGAHTVYELAYLGKRSVLIPLPNSSHSEQLHNAKMLAESGLSIVLPQSELSEESLLSSIKLALNLKSSRLNITNKGVENLLQLIKQLCEKSAK